VSFLEKVHTHTQEVVAVWHESIKFVLASEDREAEDDPSVYVERGRRLARKIRIILEDSISLKD
jgi:hypothetical protein